MEIPLKPLSRFRGPLLLTARRQPSSRRLAWVVVDTQLPGWGQAILDQLRSVTDKPVTVIINTHTANLVSQMPTLVGSPSDLALCL